MRTAYKVLAYLVAAEVAIQAMVMVWAIAGLGKWVDGGGVFDKSIMESEGVAIHRGVRHHRARHQRDLRDPGDRAGCC